MIEEEKAIEKEDIGEYIESVRDEINAKFMYYKAFVDYSVQPPVLVIEEIE